jgi:hypothetical protein
VVVYLSIDNNAISVVDDMIQGVFIDMILEKDIVRFCR